MTRADWGRRLFPALMIAAGIAGCDSPDPRDVPRIRLAGLSMPVSPETKPLANCRFPDRPRHASRVEPLLNKAHQCQIFPTTVANRVFRFYAEKLSADGWLRTDGKGNTVHFRRGDHDLTLLGVPYDSSVEGQRLRRMVLIFAISPHDPDGTDAS